MNNTTHNAAQGESVSELAIIRNKLYDSLSTGDIHVFDLIQIIKWHINDLDNYMSQIAEVPPTPSDAIEFISWAIPKYHKGNYHPDLCDQSDNWFDDDGECVAESSAQLYRLFKAQTPDHTPETGKMIDQEALTRYPVKIIKAETLITCHEDVDDNLRVRSAFVEGVNYSLDQIAALNTQISELKQSCILYYTEREELREKLTEANAIASSWMDKYHQLLSNQP